MTTFSQLYAHHATHTINLIFFFILWLLWYLELWHTNTVFSTFIIIFNIFRLKYRSTSTQITSRIVALLHKPSSWNGVGEEENKVCTI